MRYRKLGQTDLEVSVICQGTCSIATRDAFWDHQDRRDVGPSADPWEHLSRMERA